MVPEEVQNLLKYKDTEIDEKLEAYVTDVQLLFWIKLLIDVWQTIQITNERPIKKGR